MSPRVLIVDDNRDAADVLRDAMEEVGFVTRVAHDGAEALDIAKELSPDLVLLDIGLPEMNGYELAFRLRQIPGLADVRLVALTGYGPEHDRQQSAAARFDAHLVKPVDLDQLLAAVRQLLPLTGLPNAKRF